MSSLANRVLNSSFLLVASRLLQRCLGLISLMILARLLTPDDFAVAALVAIVIYFFDILGSLGTEQYIIQKGEVSSSDLNTAWTLDIIIKSGLAALLIFLAPHISAFYDQPSLTLVLSVACVVLPINALSNPGVLLHKRNLKYQRLFRLTICQKVLSFLVVMVVVFENQSYWAMVIGDIFSSIVYCFGTYVIDKYRPSLELQNVSKQWMFSKWMVAKGLVGYIRSQVDTLIVSKVFSMASLGHYHVTRNIVMLPNQVILLPALEPFLAGFTALKDNQLGSKVSVSFILIALTTTPMVGFVIAFPELLIGALLGEPWMKSGHLLASLSLLLFYFPFLQLFQQAFLAKSYVRLTFYFDLLTLIFITLVLLLWTSESIQEFAVLRGVLGVITTCLLIWLFNRIYSLKIYNMIFWLCLSIGLTTFSCVIASHIELVSSSYLWVVFLVKGSIFTALYSFITICVCWALSPFDSTAKEIYNSIGIIWNKCLVRN